MLQGLESGEPSGWIDAWKDEWLIDPPQPTFSTEAAINRQLARHLTKAGIGDNHAGDQRDSRSAKPRVVVWCRDRRQALVLPARGRVDAAEAEPKHDKVEWASIRYHLSERLRRGQDSAEDQGRDEQEHEHKVKGGAAAAAKNTGDREGPTEVPAGPSAVLAALQYVL